MDEKKRKTERLQKEENSNQELLETEEKTKRRRVSEEENAERPIRRVVKHAEVRNNLIERGRGKDTRA